MKLFVYWFALSLIVAAGWSFVTGVGRAADEELPENDDLVRERMERIRDAGNEVAIESRNR